MTGFYGVIVASGATMSVEFSLQDLGQGAANQIGHHTGSDQGLAMMDY